MFSNILAYIKEDIRNGRIPCKEKLPSTRALAKHLEVSRSTVELAYEQLLSEGYIEAEPYKGYYAAQIEDLYHLQKTKAQVQTVEQPREKYRYDFTPNGVDLKSFPYNVWRKLSKEILVDDKTELFRSGDSKGEYGFRRAICSYLYQARGVECDPGQIIIGAGSDYLLMLLCALLGTHHRIAFEDPTYMQAYRLFSCLSYELIPVGMDKNGMKVSELAQTDADIAYVTPSHQYPTGIVMPIRRRLELLRWADECDGRYIIEDDYDSEFRYNSKPIPAVQSIDAGGRVIYLGTFSKTVAPSIRISYMVLPPRLMDEYNRRFTKFSSAVSVMEQNILTEFINGGHYERHLNRMRKLYGEKRTVLLEELGKIGRGISINGENAGHHLALKLEGGPDEAEMVSLAAKEGVRVYPISRFFVNGVPSKYESTVLLGYAELSGGKIREGVRRLRKAWDI